MNNSLSHSEKALDNFLAGYNCSQSVVLAFADLLPIDEPTLAKLSSSFGGGMGRLREVCGAVSGSFMILGLLHGYSTPETGDLKAEHYARIQQFAHLFEEKQGTIICRELLKLSQQHDDPTPSPRTGEYYANRPCGRIIQDAAAILDEYLQQLDHEKSIG